jgi:20S proteasome subunit alpha 5
MIDRARIECQNHWFIYNEKMSVESAAQAVSNLAIQFGDSDDDGGAMVKHFYTTRISEHYSMFG